MPGHAPTLLRSLARACSHGLARGLSAGGLALACMLPPAAGAADWMLVTTRSDTYAIDVASIEKLPERRLRIWFKQWMRTPADLKLARPASIAVHKAYIDCNARSFDLVAIGFYDAEGELLARDTMNDPARPAAPPAAGTNGSSVVAAACLHAYGKPPRSIPVDYRIRSSAAWYKLNYIDGVNSYLGEDLIRTLGPGGEEFALYPLRLDWDTPQGSMSSAVLQAVTDCRDLSTVTVSTARFDRKLAFLYREDTDLDSPKVINAKAPSPGSVSRTAAERACAKVAASLRNPSPGAAAPAPTARAPDAPPKKAEPKASLGTGTGWHAGNGLIVTAAHVVADARTIRVIGPDGERVAARVLQFDDKNDVAVLSVGEGRGWRSVALARAPAALGSRVMTIGFPLLPDLGTAPKVTSGEISSTQGMQNDPTVYQISVPIQPGNSGGPLFNMNGEVVGMVVSKLDEAYAVKNLGTLPQNINYAVKLRYIEVLLEEANRGALPQRAAPRRELRPEELAGLNRDAVFIILAVTQEK